MTFRNSICVWLLVFLFLLLPLSIRDTMAAEGMVAAQFVKEGIQFYNREDYEKAAEAFSKALLAQPNNQEALKYLQSMGLQEGLYGHNKSLSGEIIRINQQILRYQQEIDALLGQALQRQQDFENRRAALEAQIVEQEQKNQELLNDVASFHEAVSGEMSQQAEMILQLQSEKERQASELEQVNKQLAAAETQTVEREVIAQKQDAAIARLKNEMADMDQAYRQEVLQHSEKIALLEKNKQELEHEKFQIQDRYHSDVKSLEKSIEQKDAELLLKEHKLAYTEFDAASKEARLIQRDQKIRNLQKNYAELRSQAHSLQQTIDQLKREQRFRQSLSVSSPAPSDQKAVLVERIKKQDNLILDLKDRLIVAREGLKELNAREEAGSEEAAKLNQQLSALEEDLRSKERELSVLKDDNSILESRLRDAQENLKTVQDMLRQREEQLRETDF